MQKMRHVVNMRHVCLTYKMAITNVRKVTVLLLTSALIAGVPQLANAAPLNGAAGIYAAKKTIVTSVNVIAIDEVKSKVAIDLKKSQAGKTVKVYVAGSLNGKYASVGSRKLNKNGNATISTNKNVNVGKYLRLMVGGKTVYTGKIAAIIKAQAIAPTFQNKFLGNGGFTVQIANYDTLKSRGLTTTVTTSAGSAAIDGRGVVTVTGLDFTTATTVTATTASNRYQSGSATYVVAASVQAYTTVSNEAQLRTALDNAAPFIRLTANINLTSPLNLSGVVTIDGVDGNKAITGNTITTSGTVTLKNLTLPISTNYYDAGGSANYGVFVASGSLTADNLDLTVDAGALAPDGNNNGFTVQSDASLTVQNSYITIVKRGTSGSYVVYGQSGAENITLLNNTITMTEIGDGALNGFTHLIGTETAGISGTVTVSGNTGTLPEITFLVANKSEAISKGYASWLVDGDILRVLLETKLFEWNSPNWDAVVTNSGELVAAVADVATPTIFLRPGLRNAATASIALTGPLSLSGTRTIDGIDGTTLTGNTITTSGTVTLKNLTLPISTNYYDDEGAANYGVFVASGSLTADNLDLTVDAGALAPDGNNNGFTVQSDASLTVQNSYITIVKRGTSGSYVVYGQSGAENITLLNNEITMTETTGVDPSNGFTHLVGTQGLGILGTVTVSGNTGTLPEITFLVADKSVAISKGYASWLVDGDILRVLSVPTFFVRNLLASDGWDPYIP